MEKLLSGTESGVTFLATYLASVTSVDEWIIDSGASQHMTNNRKYFKKIDPVREVANVEVGDGRSFSVEGVGPIQLKLQLSSGKTTNCVVKNVLFVPKLACNLLSVCKLAESGGKIYGE